MGSAGNAVRSTRYRVIPSKRPFEDTTVEPHEEKTTTEITEEPSVPRAKGKRRLWLFAGLGAAFLVVALGVWIVVRIWPDGFPRLTPEDEEQQKYDAEQRQREDQKAAQLRNDPFLVRKEDESQRQLNSLLKDLNIGKDAVPELPTPLSDRQSRAEEEAIAGILRKQDPVTAHSDAVSLPRRTVRTNVPDPGFGRQGCRSDVRLLPDIWWGEVCRNAAETKYSATRGQAG